LFGGGGKTNIFSPQGVITDSVPLDASLLFPEAIATALCPTSEPNGF
jgi:hypothetical protein